MSLSTRMIAKKGGSRGEGGSFWAQNMYSYETSVNVIKGMMHCKKWYALLGGFFHAYYGFTVAVFAQKWDMCHIFVVVEKIVSRHFFDIFLFSWSSCCTRVDIMIITQLVIGVFLGVFWFLVPAPYFSKPSWWKINTQNLINPIHANLHFSVGPDFASKNNWIEFVLTVEEAQCILKL